MKYRNRPMVIEATQWFPGVDVPGVRSCPACDMPEDHPDNDPSLPRWHYVVTIHGQKAWLEPGDWIITEPDGIHHYPCKAFVFEQKYEPMPSES